MTQRRKYLKKAKVVAVQLDLETDGFTYKKWGGSQKCRPKDYLVDSDGDIYTVACETFERTYQPVSPGVYAKKEPVWAEVAERGGTIPTREGETYYKAGDYIVYNNEDEEHGWAVEADVFEATYELAT